MEQTAPSAQVEAVPVQEAANLSGLTRDERQSAEAACSPAKQMQGRSAYDECLVAKAKELEAVPPVDLTGLSPGDVQTVQSLCSTEKFLKGPAAYRACLGRRVLSLP